jgi:DUF1680 family protein
MSDRISPVLPEQVKITDQLLGEYTRLVYEKVIPYQWDILNDRVPGAEPTHCIENFRINAGLSEGTHHGPVFEDSDLYKWIEAASYAIMTGHCKDFSKNIDDAVNLIAAAQGEDGYVNTFFSCTEKGKRFTNLMEGHELYCAGHLIEAGTANYQATGSRKLLDIAARFADLICATFGDGDDQIHGYPGHEEIELALVKLYRITADRKYLKEAEYFIRRRGTEPCYFNEEMARRGGRPEFFDEFRNLDMEYLQAAVPPVRQTKAEGHAVRAAYMCSAMADLALETGSADMHNACLRLWDSMTNRRMYITGSIGTSGFLERFTADYDLPNNTNYSETCASVGLMMFGQRMADLTGEASYYDVVERALYNTVLSGISQTGDRYFYVNPLEVVPEFCTEHTYMKHVKAVRQKWFSVACCPPNVARTLASLGQYIYAQDDKGIYIQQFITSEFTGNPSIRMESSLMESGKVKIHVSGCKGRRTLHIRIPDYAQDLVFMMDGKEGTGSIRRGYLVTELEAGADVEITVIFRIRPEWTAANSGVRADVGRVALKYGPCVYCLEEKDNGDHLADVFVDTQCSITPVHTQDGLFGDLPSLRFKGYRLRNTRDDGSRLYMRPDFIKEETVLTAVPYGLWGNRGGGEMTVWQKAIIGQDGK